MTNPTVSIDLVQQARLGNPSPVIGRDQETRRVIAILSQRQKNNPVLLGEPGVGKTAIVEGLVQRIVAGEVPDNLKDCRVISLNVAALLSGTKYRGEMEAKVVSFLDGITSSAGKSILFIDELHMIVGAGQAENSANDLANMLKPALARGELRCIGATTLNEYRKYIEKDPALERRFQPVIVGEPSVEATIAILCGLRPTFEKHHNVKIQDQALVAAVNLAHRYINDRYLPDKAIDLLDQAASQLASQRQGVPTEVDDLQSHLLQLKLTESMLKKDDDPHGHARLVARIAETEKHLENLRQQWELEKSGPNRMAGLRNEIDQTRKHYDRTQDTITAMQRRGELPQESLFQELTRTHATLKTLEQRQGAIEGGPRLLKPHIDQDDIARVVSQWTGIPLASMLTDERDKLLKLDDEIHRRVIAQRHAVHAVANAVRRRRAGIQDPNQPISFLFLGPTGVGKTELAKALAEILFDDPRSLIRFDMSEFDEKQNVSRLIGSAPGFIGYEEGGQLTEAVRRRPYSVVLFDELEKAHRDVYNLLLQVLDDGRLSDGQGRTVDFKNTLIIMTSNVGGPAIARMNEPDADEETIRAQVDALLAKQFPPEFLNRIGETILFHPLSLETLTHILEIQLERLEAMMASRGLILWISEDAKRQLARDGYDPAYGARPLKRVIQQRLETPLANLLLEHHHNDNGLQPVVIDWNGEEFHFTRWEPDQ